MRLVIAVVTGMLLVTTTLPVAAQIMVRFPEARALPTPGAFELVGPRTADARLTWCAAARYAMTQLGADYTTRIYVIHPRGPSQTVPGQKAVGFTITPDPEMAKGPKPATGLSLSHSLRTEGYWMLVAHGDARCRSILEDLREDMREGVRPWWQ